MSLKRHIIVAPHADDELVGAYTFFIKPNSYTILVSGGDPERTAKFKRLCTAMHKEYTVISSLSPDVLLSYDRSLVYNLIESAMTRATVPGMLNYAVVPSVFDTHPEHVFVNALAMRAATLMGLGIISYSGRASEERLMSIDEHKLSVFKQYYPSEALSLEATRYGVDNKTHYTVLKEPQ